MSVNIEQSWGRALASEFEKDYFKSLALKLHQLKAGGHVIYPPGPQIFKAFELCPLDKVKVVILGQDPYHGYGQAMGLSFSVPSNVPAPPSLKNIFKEISADCGIEMSGSPDLSPWATQGVLLLNAILTVEANMAASHRGFGWETFTDAVIHALAEKRENLVFILWGAYAQKKGRFIDRQKHLVIESPHPSPLSSYRGFFGSKPFSRTNLYLASHGLEPVKW